MHTTKQAGYSVSNTITVYDIGVQRRRLRVASLATAPGQGRIIYLAPLGSENISAPYFKQCFFQGGGITPQTVKHYASQSQDRNNK